MAKTSRTHMELTEGEKEIINEIITVCAAKIFYLVTTFNDPKDYAKEIQKFSRSRKNFYLLTFMSKIKNMTSDQFFFPQDVRNISYRIKEITNGTLKLAEDSSTYLKQWEVQEALQYLIDEGLLLNIKGKKKIKKVSPQLFPRLPKGRGLKNEKREGYYSVYRITDDVATLNQIMSNHKALKIIYTKLKGYGVLDKFYYFMCSALMHVLMEEKEKVLKWAPIASQAVFENSKEAKALLRESVLGASKESKALLKKYGFGTEDISYSVWEMIPNYLRSLKEVEFKRLVNDMVRFQLVHPIDHSYILLAIAKA